MQSLLFLLALIGGLLSGCGKGRSESAPSPYRTRDSAASDSALMDVTWQWVSLTTPVEQISVDVPERYTIRFERDGRAAVKADCNRGTAGYSVGSDRQIAFRPIALTRMMCPPGSLGDRFAREVGRATSYFVRSGDLYLELPVDSGTLRFRRPM